MKMLLWLQGFLAAAVIGSAATVPSPEKLLPDDTLMMLTVPEYAKTCEYYAKSPQNQLWRDEAMKPFLDKLSAKLTKEIVEPLEKELGVKFADYHGLAQGQLTFALIANGWNPSVKESEPEGLMLMDAGSQSDRLKTALADLRKKWADANKEIKIETIRGVEFASLSFMSEDVQNIFEKIFPDPNAGYESLSGPKKKPANKKSQLLVGQSDSLLILGKSPQCIEKVLALQAGGGGATLADNAAYGARHASLFRNGILYGWMNLKTLIASINPQVNVQDGTQPNRRSNPMAPDSKVILAALGFNSLQSAAMVLTDDGDGGQVTFDLGLPENERKGLFEMFLPEAKDSAPPPFVPADALKFSRYRLNMQHAWDTLEKTLAEINPGIAGFLAMMMAAGKDKDPTFDLRKNLIGNLGDDFISFQKQPTTKTFAGLQTAPGLMLLASPNAEQLAASLSLVPSFLPGAGGMTVKNREFLGRKIYTMPTGGGGNARSARGKGPAPGAAPSTSLHFAASGSYVAFSGDAAMLEEYLRNADAPPKALKDRPGLAAAAEKVGGMNSGLFYYENQSETMQTLIEILKKDSANIGDVISASPLGGRLGMNEDSKIFKEWLDFALLPDFDKISKYFSFSVATYQSSPESVRVKIFAPIPPGLKK